jgi:hypothetical protein
MLLPPECGLARQSRMSGLGMLLAQVEPVQAVHRHEPGEQKLPNLVSEILCGSAGLGAVDVAARDRQEVFGFDTGDITDVTRWAADFPSSQRGLEQIVAKTSYTGD